MLRIRRRSKESVWHILKATSRTKQMEFREVLKSIEQSYAAFRRISLFSAVLFGVRYLGMAWMS
jgi:hypothetical protein